MKQDGRQSRTPAKLNITFEIQGAEVQRFLTYKDAAFLRNNSEAARKLMLERLSQIEAAEATQTASSV